MPPPRASHRAVLAEQVVQQRVGRVRRRGRRGRRPSPWPRRGAAGGAAAARRVGAAAARRRRPASGRRRPSAGASGVVARLAPARLARRLRCGLRLLRGRVLASWPSRPPGRAPARARSRSRAAPGRRRRRRPRWSSPSPRTRTRRRREVRRAARDRRRRVGRALVDEQPGAQVVADRVEAVDRGRLVEDVVHQALDAAGVAEGLEHLAQRSCRPAARPWPARADRRSRAARRSPPACRSWTPRRASRRPGSRPARTARGGGRRC